MRKGLIGAAGSGASRIERGLFLLPTLINPYRPPLPMSSPSARQRAIALLENLEEDQLPRAIAALEALTQPQTQEADLIQIINRRLPQQHRFNELRQHLEAETLTEDQHTELLELSDRIEQQDAECAHAIFQLAQLRNVDIDVVLQEFSTAQPIIQ
jgi:hypothetical protein